MEKALNQLVHDAAVLVQITALRHSLDMSFQEACEWLSDESGRSVSALARACRRARLYVEDEELVQYV